jgi:hypothetical protein
MDPTKPFGIFNVYYISYSENENFKEFLTNLGIETEQQRSNFYLMSAATIGTLA